MDKEYVKAVKDGFFTLLQKGLDLSRQKSNKLVPEMPKLILTWNWNIKKKKENSGILVIHTQTKNSIVLWRRRGRKQCWEIRQ